VISSDSDVASFQPMRTIGAAMTRLDRWGMSFDPAQRLTLEQALQSHTHDAAVAIGRGHDLGQLQPGYKADVTVLDSDVRTTEPARIAEVGVRGVLLDGKWVASPHAH
jgi:predicted amidohydrolase YtcJ